MKKTYAYHKPTDEALVKIAELRKKYSLLHTVIERVAPLSREQSIALSCLEDSAMWAIKSVVCNDPNSVVDPDATFGKKKKAKKAKAVKVTDFEPL